MIRRFLSVLLALILCVSLFACAGGGDASSSSSGTTGSISSYISLFGHEYPEYTYEGYSKCTTEAFTQVYQRRTPPTYIRKLGDY